MMELNKDFSIKYAGLSNGNHDFTYDINKTFFEPFIVDEEEYDVDGKAFVQMEKLSTMLVFDITIDVKWKTDCDTCGEFLLENIHSEDRFFVKFGNEDSDNEEVVILPTNESEINISPYIYEYFITAIPLRKVHEKKDCNQEVLKKLESLKPSKNNGGEENNPFWDQLKNLN